MGDLFEDIAKSMYAPPFTMRLRPTMEEARCWDDETGQARGVISVEAGQKVPAGNYLLLVDEPAEPGDVELEGVYFTAHKVEYLPSDVMQVEAVEFKPR